MSFLACRPRVEAAHSEWLECYIPLSCQSPLRYTHLMHRAVGVVTRSLGLRPPGSGAPHVGVLACVGRRELRRALSFQGMMMIDGSVEDGLRTLQQQHALPTLHRPITHRPPQCSRMGRSRTRNSSHHRASTSSSASEGQDLWDSAERGGV